MNKRIFLDQCYINHQNLERLYGYMVGKQFWRVNKECVTSAFGYQNTIYSGEDRSGTYFFNADVVSGSVSVEKLRGLDMRGNSIYTVLAYLMKFSWVRFFSG